MGKRMEEAIARYQEIQQKNLLGGGIQHNAAITSSMVGPAMRRLR